MLTKEQFDHYIKGGKFLALYNPKKTDDLVGNNSRKIGYRIIVYQNMFNHPLQYPPKWMGQHAFSSPEIYGWFPEEDIEIIEILNEFIDYVEPIPVYLYRMTFTRQESILPNFGKGNFTAPMIVSREYHHENDDFVRTLANPPADKIEKAVWNGTYQEELKWQEI